MRRISLLLLVFSSLLFVSSPAAANSVRNGTTSIIWAHPDTGEMALNFMVDIEGVSQGAWGLVSTDRIQSIVFDAGDGVSIFSMEQSMRIELSISQKSLKQQGDGPLPLKLNGGAVARLQSLATGTTFDWEPRVSNASYGQCWVFSGVIDRCEIAVDLIGKINSPGGGASCGSLQQSLAFELVRANSGLVFGGFKDSPAVGGDAAGLLAVTTEKCSQAIYGIMPGDNVSYLRGQQVANVSMSGLITGRSGGAWVADITFEGQLRNGLPISGRGEARLSFERNDQLRLGSTASGDVRFTAIVGEGDAAVWIEGRGRVALESVIFPSDRDEDRFIGSGTVKYLPSSTEGTTTD